MASQDTDDPDDDLQNIWGAGRRRRQGEKGAEKSRTPVLDNFGRDLTRRLKTTG